MEIKDSGFERLASIKDSLPIKEEIKFCTKLKTRKEVSKETKIIRPVKYYTTGKKEIVNVKFEKTERNSYLIKAVSDHSYFTDFHIAVNSSRSMVCFCEKFIPENWIYFKVTGLSKTGSVAFVEPVVGSEAELFEFYNFEDI